MASFHFTAIDTHGQIKNGTMDAPDAAFVVDQLQREGSIPVRAEPAGWSNALRALFAANLFGRQHLRRSEMTLVLRELATMLGAGQDLDRSLRFIVETAPSRSLRAVMQEVRNKVRGGNPLNVALAEPPAGFPKLQVGLVHAAEAGGTLPETLQQLAEMMEREQTLIRTLASALVYPAILVIAALLSIGMLVGYVLPQFAPLFRESGAQLPWATRVLLAIGNRFAAVWPMLLVAILVLTLVVPRLLRVPAVRLRTDRALLRFPIVGSLLREGNAARFCRTLGTLVGNGVPLISALNLLQQTIGNRVAHEAIDRAIQTVKEGEGLSQALAESRAFPARATHLLRLGEETAQLAPMALRAAQIHEERARQNVQQLVSIMVPIITVVMGGVVGSIVGSLLLAMLSLNDLAQ